MRAYAGTAAEALAGADIREYRLCRTLVCTVGYEHFDALKKFFAAGGAAVKDVAYSDRVAVTAAVEAAQSAQFCAALSDHMAGRVAIREGETYLFPFEPGK